MKKLLFIFLIGNFLFAQGNLLWKKEGSALPAGGSSWSSPLIMNNKIFWAGQDSGFVALNLDTGDIVWTDNTNFYNGTYDSPVGYLGKIFISRNDYNNTSARSLLALDAETGTVIWEKNNFYAANRSSKPIGQDGKLYTASDDTLYCFNINNGSVVWQKKGKYSNLLIDYNGVYLYAARSDSAKIEAINSQNGNITWSINLTDPAVSISSLAYTNYLSKEYLIVAPGTSQKAIFYCIDLVAQSILWSSDQIGYVGNNAAPVIYQDKVVAGVAKTTPSVPQEIVAFNLTTGSVLWQNQARTNGATNTPFVLVLDGKVFYHTDVNSKNAGISADLANGNILWNTLPEFVNSWPLVWGTPLMYNNKIYLSKDSEGIFCYNAGTVAGEWTMQGGNIYATNSYFAGLVGVEENEFTIPTDYLLYQNYPNPFNPSTTIKYSVPVTGFVKIMVYNLLGKEIKRLVSEEKSPGNYEVSFNGSSLASGMYFIRLESGETQIVRKMILLK